MRFSLRLPTSQGFYYKACNILVLGVGLMVLLFAFNTTVLAEDFVTFADLFKVSNTILQSINTYVLGHVFILGGLVVYSCYLNYANLRKIKIYDKKYLVWYLLFLANSVVGVVLYLTYHAYGDKAALFYKALAFLMVLVTNYAFNFYYFYSTRAISLVDKKKWVLFILSNTLKIVVWALLYAALAAFVFSVPTASNNQTDIFDPANPFLMFYANNIANTNAISIFNIIWIVGLVAVTLFCHYFLAWYGLNITSKIKTYLLAQARFLFYLLIPVFVWYFISYFLQANELDAFLLNETNWVVLIIGLTLMIVIGISFLVITNLSKVKRFFKTKPVSYGLMVISYCLVSFGLLLVANLTINSIDFVNNTWLWFTNAIITNSLLVNYYTKQKNNVNNFDLLFFITINVLFISTAFFHTLDRHLLINLNGALTNSLNNTNFISFMLVLISSSLFVYLVLKLGRYLANYLFVFYYDRKHQAWRLNDHESK